MSANVTDSMLLNNDMNVKLQHMISCITGMDIIEAKVQGERNPRRLAQLRGPRIKAPSPSRCRGTGGMSAYSSWPGGRSFTGPVRPRQPSAIGRLKPSRSG